MGDYIPRCVDAVVERYLGIFGAVLVQGPKWCGKTTTARRFAASALSLTDPVGGFAARRMAELDPSQAIAGDSPRLIDEWQEVPDVWDAVRYECDMRGEPGQFILTGSATPRDDRAPMHSGVGRIARVRMETMSLAELGISTGEVSLGSLLDGDNGVSGIGGIKGLADIAELVCRGGWPQTAGVSTSEAMEIATAYVDGVCESDVSRIDGVRRDPGKIRALLTSLARSESTLSSPKAIGADTDGKVSKSTLTRYMDALRRVNVVDDIPAWYPALRSPVRLRQAPKRHLADPSLAVSLLGASPASLTSDPKTLGLLFESLVLHDLKVYAAANDARLSHYHDGNDLEVDGIVHTRDGAWAAVEVKLGASQVPEAVSNLLRLEQLMVSHGDRPPAAKCVVIGYGMPCHVTPEGVIVIPIDVLGS